MKYNRNPLSHVQIKIRASAVVVHPEQHTIQLPVRRCGDHQRDRRNADLVHVGQARGDCAHELGVVNLDR